MKKIIGLILVFVLLFAVTSQAFAGSKPQITKDPESATVKKGGKVTFSIKTKGAVSTVIWHFVDPVTGNDYTGKKLAGAVKGVKVVGATNGKKITLNKVPEEMHGWKVYAHVNGNGYKIDSQPATLLIAGMDNASEAPTEKPVEQPAEAPAEEPSESPASEEPANDTSEGTSALISVEFLQKSVGLKENVEFVAVTSLDAVKLTMYTENQKEVESWTTEYSDDGNTRTWKAHCAFSRAGNRTMSFIAFDNNNNPSVAKSANITIVDPEAGEAAEVDEGPKTFTITATSKILRPLDDSGNVIDYTPTSSLEITGIGYAIISSEEPIISWTLNGIRIQPAEPVNEFRVLNVTSDLSIDIVTSRVSAADAVVDEDHMCKVTCKGCTFSYIRGKLKSVTEGEVPAGAPINIVADNSALAKNGYSINGGEPEYQGKAGFRFVVNEDVEIVCGQ